MILTLFTLVHVLISLVGIVTGFVVFHGMLVRDGRPAWTRVFLTTTVLTSVTGFMFPFKGFTPALGFGILSMILLGLAIHALYRRKLAGRWRVTYVATALFAQYLNVFVLVVQSFQKIPPLHALAPTQSEPPFGIAQGTVLILFLSFGFAAAKRFGGKAEGGPEAIGIRPR